jgi:hypothetical protein
MKPDAIICALYTRVSSRNQADADYSSLETQRERLEPTARAKRTTPFFGFTKMADTPQIP